MDRLRIPKERKARTLKKSPPYSETLPNTGKDSPSKSPNPAAITIPAATSVETATEKRRQFYLPVVSQPEWQASQSETRDEGKEEGRTEELCPHCSAINLATGT